MEQDLGIWYSGIPKIFRNVFTAMFAGPLFLRFKMVDPGLLIADFEKVYKSFHLWRPFTACVITGVSFHWLIMLYMFYQYGRRLSEGTFGNRPADECFFYLCLVFFCNLAGWMFGLKVFYDLLVLGVIYVWAQCNRDVMCNFYFGIKMKAAYLPWALAGFSFVLQNDPTGFLGCAVGHLYFFMKFKWPTEFGGRDFLITPAFLQRMFPATRQNAGQNVQFRRPATDAGGHNWGQGQRLGD